MSAPETIFHELWNADVPVSEIQFVCWLQSGRGVRLYANGEEADFPNLGLGMDGDLSKDLTAIKMGMFGKDSSYKSTLAQMREYQERKIEATMRHLPRIIADKQIARMSYEAYLESDAWKLLRQAVLKRDGFKCTQCNTAVATQVHHLTYENLYNEPMEDLTSVCVPCHELLHPRKHTA